MGNKQRAFLESHGVLGRDEYGDEEAGAPQGLEALTGMETVSPSHMLGGASVAEAGLVTIPARGMKQVQLLNW